MNSLMVLFKHELKMLFPILSFNKKKKHDIIGTILTLILTLTISIVVVMLVSKIANGYIQVKIDKVTDLQTRATELFNVLYLIAGILMVFATIKKMKSTLTMEKYKQIYLRMPVSEQTLFLSKLLALLVWVFVSMLILILPINIIFAIVLDFSFVFSVKTIFVIVTMPIVVFGISGILLVPAIKVIDFLKNKYLLLFIILSALVGFAFIVYSRFLEIVKLWLETGSIKFLFNKNFIENMQKLLKFSYPSNCFANFMMGRNLISSTVLILLFVAISVVVSNLISNKLFHITIYKDEITKTPKVKARKFTQGKTLFALIKKEFICVSREARYLFSYFAITVTMPIMAYCCYTLFESLIVNAFGLKITFPLAMLVLLMFGILTNTFCVTNITREGTSFLKMKTVPVAPTKLLIAKVLFCSIISSLAIVISSIVLMSMTNVSILEGVICCVIVIIFSISQILISTKLDLNHAKFSNTTQENESMVSKNLTKAVLLGLVVSLTIGISSVVASLFSRVGNFNIKVEYIYVGSILMSVIYFACAYFYYSYNLKKRFNNIVG